MASAPENTWKGGSVIREEYIRVCEEQEWDIREYEEGTVELRTTTKHEGDFSFKIGEMTI